MASHTFSLLLTLFLLLPFSTAITTTSITNAATILADSGFASMSLILPLIAPPLLATVPTATLFTPSDISFSLSLSTAQPSFSLLQFHFSPLRYSIDDLHSLKFLSQIPTLNPNSQITVTTLVSDHLVSLNSVNVDDSAVFDDGFLIIFKIDRFLNPNFIDYVSPSPSPSPNPNPNPSCPVPVPVRVRSYADVVSAMRSRGFTSMAMFFDLQLSRVFDDVMNITVFAPSDAAMEGQFGNFTEVVSLFRRHVVPCEVIWGDFMESGNDGVSVVLSTFLDGFLINVRRFGDNLMVNDGIKVDYPEVYSGDGVLVYGLSQVLEMNQKSDDDGDERKGTVSAPDWMYDDEF